MKSSQMLVFEERETGVPGENLSVQSREPRHPYTPNTTTSHAITILITILFNWFTSLTFLNIN